MRRRREPDSLDFADVDGFDFVVGDDLPDSDMVSTEVVQLRDADQSEWHFSPWLKSHVDVLKLF